MAEAAFDVAYDGPALATGRMPVRELAPALLALGDLFADASAMLYSERPPVALNIEATEPGSFTVRLILEAREGVWGQVVDIFGSDEAGAIANLIEIVTATGGLFWLIRKLRGQPIETADEEVAPEPGRIRIVVDGDVVEVRSEVGQLYRDVEIRRKARQVVAPLTHDGIEELKFDPEGLSPVVIENEDVPAFEPPGTTETLLDQEREMVLEIVALSFKQGNKWRFSDGQRTITAPVQDEHFVDAVQSGQEAFRKGDILRCRVRIIQTRREDGLHTDYIVVEVLEHLPRAQQMSMDDY